MKNRNKTLTLKISSIGDMTRQLLTSPINPDAAPGDQVRLTNQEIAREVSKIFPKRKAKGSAASDCVAWYVSQMKKKEYQLKHKCKAPLPTSNDIPSKEVTVTIPQNEDTAS